VRILWKLRQQRGLKMVLAYVTNVLVKMNMFRTRCMLFYFAKNIEFVSWGNNFPFCLHLFLRTVQQPNPFCCNRSTTNLFMISFFSRALDRLFLCLSELMDLFVAGRDQSAADQPNNPAEGHPPLEPLEPLQYRDGIPKLWRGCSLCACRAYDGIAHKQNDLK